MRALVAPLRRAAHLHRRHAARRGPRRHRARPDGQAGHGRRRAGRRRHHDRPRRRAAQPATTPRVAGTSSTASRAPCRRPQALDEITGEQPIDVVLDLDVPRELVLARLSARRVCRDCGTNYVASGDEKSPWICEVCGGDVMQRDDDTPEAINHRLDLYEEQTVAADRVLPEPGSAGGHRRRRIPRRRVPPARCCRRRDPLRAER